MANVKLTYINPTGGYAQTTTTSDVVQSLGKIELTGVSSVGLTLNNSRIENLGAPASANDAATKAYVDAIAQGLAWKAPVRVVAVSNVTLSGAQTVDSVALTDGDRVLITGQNGAFPDAGNGIYVVSTSGAWSRADDAGAGELNAGTAVFATEGTVYADTQWVLLTDNPITVGTTPIIFGQFGGGLTYSAGNGLALVGTTFSVDLATNSGLEFSGTELQIDVADTNELSLDANGLNVEGVPSQFKINGSAVSANVTATNLNALTDGTSITALHRHDIQIFSATVGTSGVTAGYPVYVNSSGQVVDAAASSPSTAGVVGLAVSTVSSGNPGGFVASGKATGFSGLTAGDAYFLPDAGGIPVAYSAITSGYRAIRIGFALDASTLLVNIQDMGVKP